MSSDEQSEESYDPYAAEIQHLASELHRLSIETRSISERLHGLQEAQREDRRASHSTEHAAGSEEREEQNRNSTKDLQTGDRVKITNNYHGARGTTGTIVRVTPATVLIKPDGGGNNIRRFKENVQRISQK
jgi:preprotein translocase subunit YajC